MSDSREQAVLDDLNKAQPQMNPRFQRDLEDQLINRLKEQTAMQQATTTVPNQPQARLFSLTLAAAMIAVMLAGVLAFILNSQPPTSDSAAGLMQGSTETPLDCRLRQQDEDSMIPVWEGPGSQRDFIGMFPGNTLVEVIREAPPGIDWFFVRVHPAEGEPIEGWVTTDYPTVQLVGAECPNELTPQPTPSEPSLQTATQFVLDATITALVATTGVSTAPPLPTLGVPPLVTPETQGSLAPLPLCRVILKVSGVTLRTQPSESASQSALLRVEQVVNVIEQQRVADGQIWYYVRTEIENIPVQGWVRSDVVEEIGPGCPAISDEPSVTDLQALQTEIFQTATAIAEMLPAGTSTTTPTPSTMPTLTHTPTLTATHTSTLTPTPTTTPTHTGTAINTPEDPLLQEVTQIIRDATATSQAATAVADNRVEVVIPLSSVINVEPGDRVDVLLDATLARVDDLTVLLPAQPDNALEAMLNVDSTTPVTLTLAENIEVGRLIAPGDEYPEGGVILLVSEDSRLQTYLDHNLMLTIIPLGE